jgi:MarR family transcriptional regulator, organic hydroperoxide resistance regulator
MLANDMLTTVHTPTTRDAPDEGVEVSAENVEAVSASLRKMVCFNFYRGWRGISAYYRHYLPEGVSAQQTYVLELCEVDAGVDVGTVANALEIDSPAVSSLLRRMEASSLVRRQVVTNNRRRTLVFLTEEGAKLREEWRERACEADRELFKSFTSADVQQLASLVDKIFDVVKARDEAAAVPSPAVLLKHWRENN